MAAELEELVVSADAVEAEELAPDLGEEFLVGSEGGLERSSGDVEVEGLWQGVSVELSVVVEGECVERDERAGDHVLGEVGGERRTELGEVEGGVGDEVRDEALVVSVGSGEDDGLADVGEGGEVGLDLAELDAEAADLDLEVVSSLVGELAVWGAAGEVSGLVHPVAVSERVVEEPLCGEVRPAEVPAGEAGSGDVQLSGDADGNGLEVGVEQVQSEVGQGGPDGGVGALTDIAGGDRSEGDVYGGLGDAVHVDEAHGVWVVSFDPRSECVEREGLASEHDPPEGGGGVCASVSGDECAEGARGLAQHGDALGGEEGVEVVGGAGDPGGYDDEGSAGGEGAEQLPHGEVERDGVEQGPTVVGSEVEAGVGGGEQPPGLSVLDEDALGLAGGAGGVDDVGGAGREDPEDGDDEFHAA
ncbi:MAG: hypothetical protein ABMA64_08485, partial [Myxococcota bacterium]